MWRLKCVDNEKITETIAKSIIDIRSFFVNNGNCLDDMTRDIVMFMGKNEKIKFYFPNKIKYIEVEFL